MTIVKGCFSVQHSSASSSLHNEQQPIGLIHREICENILH